MRIQNYTVRDAYDEEWYHFMFDVLGVSGNDTAVLASVDANGLGATYSASIPRSDRTLVYRFDTDQPLFLQPVYMIGTQDPFVGYHNTGETAESDITIDLIIDSTVDLTNPSTFPAFRVARDAYIVDTIMNHYGVLVDEVPIYMDPNDTVRAAIHLSSINDNYISWPQQRWNYQKVCREYGHQVHWQLADDSWRPYSSFDDSGGHSAVLVSDTLWAYTEGFAIFTQAICTYYQDLRFAIPGIHYSSTFDDNVWWQGESENNDTGEIVEGAVAAILIDLYDDNAIPPFRLSWTEDDDGVDNNSLMMPSLVHCMDASNYGGTPAWSLRVLIERLVQDETTSWADDHDFDLLREDICNVLCDNRFTIPDSITNPPDYCGGSTVADREQDHNESLPEGFALLQSYPNPFNGSVNLGFHAPKMGEYSLDVYNIIGQRVHSTTKSVSSAGVQSFELGDDVTLKWSSGVFFYVISGDGKSDSKKMVLIK